jgi:hypothetical protein
MFSLRICSESSERQMALSNDSTFSAVHAAESPFLPGSSPKTLPENNKKDSWKPFEGVGMASCDEILLRVQNLSSLASEACRLS